MPEIIDDPELIEVFYEEAQNLIYEMRKDLSTLKDGQDVIVLGRLFRHAHTIKSSSRAVGFIDLEKATQALEKIFKAASDGKTVITADIISLISESVEACQKLLNKEEVVEYKKLLERLRIILYP